MQKLRLPAKYSNFAQIHMCCAKYPTAVSACKRLLSGWLACFLGMSVHARASLAAGSKVEGTTGTLWNAKSRCFCLPAGEPWTGWSGLLWKTTQRWYFLQREEMNKIRMIIIAILRGFMRDSAWYEALAACVSHALFFIQVSVLVFPNAVGVSSATCIQSHSLGLGFMFLGLELNPSQGVPFSLQTVK